MVKGSAYLDFCNNTLYSPSYEHDACGVGLVVKIDGSKHHSIVDRGLSVLENMAHRGAEGADSKTGDGAGIMLQIPHEYILLNGIPVPEKGRYGVAMVFLPRQEEDAGEFDRIIEDSLNAEGLYVMRRREVPVDSSVLGHDAAEVEPLIRQYFIVGCDNQELFEQKLFLSRKRIEAGVSASPKLNAKEECYIVSCSTSTIVYKGMLTSQQLRQYYKDLQSPYFTSAIAMVHSRFSTNTFPSWKLAQPFRMICHNGEINTIKGNRFWMTAREAVVSPEKLGGLNSVTNVIQPGMSDSASFDNATEFFVRSGMSLPHTLAMLVPESCDDNNPRQSHMKAFYEYHSIFMAPWDGPAAVLFSDGRYAGGTLDRNGLRPARVAITKSGEMVVASETGVAEIPADEIVSLTRLKPGKILMADTHEGKILVDKEIKEALFKEHPYRDWISHNRVVLNDVKSGRKVSHEVSDMDSKLLTFGYGKEDVEVILKPMVNGSAEPVASMGNDTPLAVLSERPQKFFNYFRQQFAQVTNPPIDPIREELVMSLTSYVGAVNKNILSPAPDLCNVVMMNSPIVSDSELDKLRHLQYKGFQTVTLPMVFEAAGGASAMERALDNMCVKAEDAVDHGYNYMILSDRDTDASHAPLPSLLALAAVHNHLSAKGKRSQIAIIVESGEILEVMHVALLMGFGASAVNPYMAFALIKRLVDEGDLKLDFPAAESHYIKAVNKGMLKVMSKMGISTIRSYRGCALFEALGVSRRLLSKYMGIYSSTIEGVDLAEVAMETLERHSKAYGNHITETLHSSDGAGNSGNCGASGAEKLSGMLEHHGIYSWRKCGERHAWSPDVVRSLRKAASTNDSWEFAEFVAKVEGGRSPLFLRDLLRVKSDRRPIPVEEVEGEDEIMRRFVAGGMSFGALSEEAHRAIARAMNSIGSASNSGEGGEDPARNVDCEDGGSEQSRVRQVASGRFGVDTEYLVNASEIQIKVAQGAKPGEGGQLPGFKVDMAIAKMRRSLPGITLISPPPHHDIYSIEDLAQLIFDLKNVNPEAEISVKLVAESGVGTIAAGVAKAKADKILISGCDGGTGASPASSMKHAGVPFEIGLAETQQTLVLNNLRGKVKLQVDGQLKSPHDIIVSAMLGAEEFGFGTALLVAMGCCMDRRCNTNKCPKGLATQDAALRSKFEGSSEDIVNYLRLLASEVRVRLAQMGYNSLRDIVGRADLLEKKDFPENSKVGKVSLDRLCHTVGAVAGISSPELHFAGARHEKIDGVKDLQLLQFLRHSLENAQPISLGMPIKSTDRSVGAMLSGYIVKTKGAQGLPDDTVHIDFTGSAGQSFGAFLAKGVTLRLEGDANDYVGKGLSGGKIIMVPPKDADFPPERNVIAGNTLLYGATSGELYANGRAGERFAVRNSGAVSVVEGVGDHACEYMTGGIVVVLGKIGRNFGAGMSGGIAYVWNPNQDADSRINMELLELELFEDEEDKAQLHELVSRHAKVTGSQLAQRMLADWNTYLPQFLKVIPSDYKRMTRKKSATA